MSEPQPEAPTVKHSINHRFCTGCKKNVLAVRKSRRLECPDCGVVFEMFVRNGPVGGQSNF